MTYQRIPSPNRAGHPGKTTALVNPALKALRAEAVMKARAQGVPMKELAVHYRCSENTLYSLLQWAKKEGLMRELRDRVVEELAPLSINVYRDALTANVDELTPNQVKAHKMKISAAKDVNAGSGVFQKHSESKQVKEEFSLQAYYDQRDAYRGESPSETIEAEIAESEDSIPLLTEEVPASHEPVDDLGGLSEQSDSGDGSEPTDGDPEE